MQFYLWLNDNHIINGLHNQENTLREYHHLITQVAPGSVAIAADTVSFLFYDCKMLHFHIALNLFPMYTRMLV